MSQGFSPGLPRAHAAGVAVAAAPYSEGQAGHAQSLALMAQKIAAGRLDPDVIGWARSVLHKAGIDGRSDPPVRRMTQAILNELRAVAPYFPDPAGAEVIQSPAATLCLRPGLCLRGGDCDDQVVALTSALLAVGITAVVVKEDYGDGIQSHVLTYVLDERGTWLPADPSTQNPVGTPSAFVQNRTIVDPLEGTAIQIVGIGRPYAGVGDVAPTVQWIPVTGNTVTQGLRYAVGIVAPATWTAEDAKAFFAADWSIDQVQSGSVGGAYTAWVMIGLARVTKTLESTADVNIAGIYQQTSNPAVNPPPGPITPAAPSAATTSSIGAGALVAGVIGAIAVGGIAYGLYRRRHRRSR